VNNGGFALKWRYHDCRASFASGYSNVYPADVLKCMNAEDLFPDVKQGDVQRIGNEIIDGLHEIPDPSFRYVPSSNSVGFVCTGSTLLYKCELASVAPVNPGALPDAQSVCIINHAGFDLSFEFVDLRTMSSSGRSDIFAINQQRCVDLGTTVGIQEGDHVQVQVHAIGGISKATERQVRYKPNGLSVAYQCKGATFSYACRILAEPVAAYVQVERVCVVNHGGFALYFDSLDLRTQSYAGRSNTYPSPQEECSDLGRAAGAQEGDEFEVWVQAIAGVLKSTDSRVKYRRNKQTAIFRCSGSTTEYDCRLLMGVFSSTIATNSMMETIAV